MKIWYSGFNLYNQIKASKDLIIEDFTLFEYDLFNDILFSHTYAVIQTENTLQFQGGTKTNIYNAKNEDISKAMCVDNITYVLNNTGNIMRIDSATDELKLLPNFLNVENPADDDDYITDIACGAKINVAISKSNKIFNIPNKLDYKGRKIKQIVTGHEHCLILDSNGDVYSFGCGIRGQLGHGELEDEVNPRLIDALAGVKINKVAAGGWHSCAISSTGDLYTWGWNSNGQLGLSHEKDVSVFATPEPVCFDDPDCNVDYVACGSKHTIVLIGNQLFGAGWNKYKQLGNISDESVQEFKLLKSLCDYKIQSLRCGPWCSAVITD